LREHSTSPLEKRIQQSKKQKRIGTKNLCGKKLLLARSATRKILLAQFSATAVAQKLRRLKSRMAVLKKWMQTRLS
jgi:hypothetical protein